MNASLRRACETAECGKLIPRGGAVQHLRNPYKHSKSLRIIGAWPIPEPCMLRNFFTAPAIVSLDTPCHPASCVCFVFVHKPWPTGPLCHMWGKHGRKHA